jgi:Acetyltransferase (GNAT) family
MVRCDPAPDQRLTLKIAETQDELEACFRILHDAYVSSGFMKPHPSGLRVTPYHALPTTTTLCAKFDGQVVGTISLIREGVFGFPMQSAFKLQNVKLKGGKIAEISSLAVQPEFRQNNGFILFPLMKFMREYCTTYFDTRHIVIAVNPDRIEMYESLLFFERLQQTVVESYDFANGAPAIGAALDLSVVQDIFKRYYGRKSSKKNLYSYFFDLKLPHIQLPDRRYFTTNDPVMTPAMLDYFFNQRTRTFDSFDERKRLLMHSIYDLQAYHDVLPKVSPSIARERGVRQHQRYSLKCPGRLEIQTPSNQGESFKLQVTELSLDGFYAESDFGMPLDMEATVTVELGQDELATVRAKAVRTHTSDFGQFYGFHVEKTDSTWERCVEALQHSQTASDLKK